MGELNKPDQFCDAINLFLTNIYIFMTNLVKTLTALKKLGRTRLASVAFFINFLLSSANTIREK
ncbi:hypothetical protein C7N43_38815 [Sphingobacteriales bacterium UPWRP_1]|nr:hypothetical protein C7N43_38815 [Sphingobacteriales bacterium UPWRP_1]